MNLSLLSVFLVAAVSVQDEEERLPSPEVHYLDPAAVDADLYASDLARVDAVVSSRGIEVVVTMARPFVEGMYTCAHLTFDCDRDPSTGVGGAELYFRAAVGSRFRPNAWKPELPGVPGPLENLRCSYSEVFGEGGDAPRLKQNRNANSPRTAPEKCKYENTKFAQMWVA